MMLTLSLDEIVRTQAAELATSRTDLFKEIDEELGREREAAVDRG